MLLVDTQIVVRRESDPPLNAPGGLHNHKPPLHSMSPVCVAFYVMFCCHYLCIVSQMLNLFGMVMYNAAVVAFRYCSHSLKGKKLYSASKKQKNL